MAFRTWTLEEAKNAPPPTSEEIAERGVAMAAWIADGRLRFDEFVARGGHVMTEKKAQEFWDSRWDDDWDDESPESDNLEEPCER